MDSVEVHPLVWTAGPDTLIEAPPGFKWLAMKIAEKTGAAVSGRPVWGSCDVKIDPTYRKLFHLGHGVPPNIAHLLEKNLGARVVKLDTDLYKLVVGSVEAYFIPVYYKPPDVLPTLRGEGTIYFPVPYRRIAEELSRRSGIPMAKEPITGCWVGERPSGVAYVVATGLFYPITLKLFFPDAVVYQIDPFRNEVRDVEPEFARLMKLKARSHLVDAKRVAVVVSTKPGQRQDEKARELAARGVTVVVLDEVSPDLIDDLQVDLVVNTACPRIGIDDLDRVKTPVLNYYEYIEGKLDSRLAVRML
ncbi:diphthamide biosynthesis enzyme Dph1/Dph2 domain protein [Pyrobaculum oguniense TE7]|uniref:2-(3-amino-3-carboxypropyl)histidine synthase n=1 Tax=Pyrobaculum oguniense (strain DSM 13380 / JCM 10595 / TE7) TaxID=698757 RepID=H6Q9P7_PYROT|nr:diphthamide biosynthesis enzyme Dph1/Dph2 domain protein [Pyrobaculum oguniense TE7]